MKNTKIEWCDHTVNFWWAADDYILAASEYPAWHSKGGAK